MILKRVRFLLFKGSERSVLVKKNIFASFIIKGLSIIISFLYVPITLNYLNPTRYGIWMTLMSIVAWMGIFDIGFGHGLRNKLAEAFAIGEKKSAKIYVSTAYAILSLISIGIILIFFILDQWIDWSLILNSPPEYGDELNLLVKIVIVFFGFQFVLKIISTIFIADQLPSISGIFDLIGNSIGLLIVWLLIITKQSSLVTFGGAIMLAPVFVYLVASIVAFRKKYSEIKPSIKSVDFSCAKQITGLGIQFFIIHIAFIVIFQTSNIIISHFFSPEEVTPYNITFRYFSVLTMTWGIIMTPFWSAFTQAKTHNDFYWMRNTLKILNRFILISLPIIIIMIWLAKPVILLWTNGQVSIMPIMAWIFGFFTFVSIWNNIYSFFLNGTGHIKSQIYTSLIALFLHFPLAYFLVKYVGMGSEGIVLSMTISLLLFAIVGPIETYKLLRKWTNN